MYTLYILKSEKDNKRYIGYTNNIKRRVSEHNQGKVKSTTKRRPLKLIYSEKYSDKFEAEKREKFLKSGQGRKLLNEGCPPKAGAEFSN